MASSGTVDRAPALVEIAKIANHRFDEPVADAGPIATARVRRAGACRRLIRLEPARSGSIRLDPARQATEHREESR